MSENAKTCENCRSRCGGLLGAGPSECGSWEAMPTAQAAADAFEVVLTKK